MKKLFIYILILGMPLIFSVGNLNADIYGGQIVQFKKAIQAANDENWDIAKSEILKIKNPVFHSPNYFYYYKSLIELNWVINKKNIKYRDQRLSLISSYDNSKMISEDIGLNDFLKKVKKLKLDILENMISLGSQNKDHFLVIKYSEELSFFRSLRDDEILNYVNSMFELKLISKGQQVLRHYFKLISKSKTDLPKLTKFHFDKMVKENEEKQKRQTVEVNDPIRANENDNSDVFLQENYYDTITKIINNRFIKKEETDELIKKLKNILFSERAKELQQKVLSKYETIAKLQNPIENDEYFKNKIEDHLDLFDPELLLSTANYHWNSFAFEKAIKFGEDIIKFYPKFENIPKTHFYLGRIYQDSKKYKESIPHFDNVIEHGYGSKYFEFAFFQKAWSYYLSEDYDLALKAFAIYVKNFPEGEHAQATRYFTIKVLKKLQKDQKTIEKWEKDLLTNGEIEFYSVLYLYNNQKSYPYRDAFKLQKNSDNYFKNLIGTSVILQGKLNRVEELVRLSLFSDAKDILNSVPLTLENLYFLMNYAYLLKDDGIPLMAIYYTRSVYELGIIPNVTSLRHVFPLRWFKDIKGILSKLKWDVSPYLVISLIRQESVFDLKAMSPSNAKGPMQLIDSTARLMADNLNLKSFDVFDLKDNLLLGISNLKTEYDKFDKNIYLALAAYNAGPVATSRWQQVRGELPPLEFIESIPYKETRTYVKTILRNYFFYQMIYENKSLKEAELLIKDLK